MQPTIEDFWDPYNQLLKSFELRDQNSTLLINLFTKVKTTYENIATWFRTLGESFHKDLLKDSSNEQSYTYYQYLGNYLLKVSEVNKEFSKSIQSSVLNPYTESSRQIDTKTRENLDKINKALINIQSSKNILKRHQENYYKLSKSADKTQEAFEKLVSSNKPEDQIMKGQEKFMKVKMDAQEAANLYRQNIKTTNQNFEVLYATYEPIFELYDELETQKTNKTKDAVLSLVKSFNSFYPSMGIQLQDNPEDKFKELEEKPISKINNLQLLTNGRLDEILKNKPMEEYLSYEAKKKIDELTIVKSVENDEYTVIYSASNENDLQFIIDFTKLFQSNRSINQTNEFNMEIQKDEHNESTLSLDSSASRERSMSTDSQSLLKIPLTNDEEKKLLEIAKNPVNRKFLLENLHKSQDIFKDSDTILISLKSYKYLKSFLWKILDIIMEEKDFDNLSTFLNVIFRYSTKKGGVTLYLFEHFRGQKMWLGVDLWKDIVKNFYEKKAGEEAEKQKKIQENEKLNKSFAQAPFMDKIINYGMKQFLEKTRSKETLLSDNDVFNIYFSILHDVAFYLAKLTDTMSSASEVLITIASDLGFESIEIEDLISVIKKERNVLLRGETGQYLIKKQQRGSKKWGKYYPFYLALDYLELKDLLNLLQLNHQTRKLFKNKIYRTLFDNFGNELTTTKRFKIWANILEINKINDIDFRSFLKEYENTDNAILKQAEEVINIDIVRSFKKHGEYNQEELKELLKGYAALDKEASYCQGMNYIMGFFYLHTRDADLSFKYFTRLMQKHMNTMFDKEFKQLRNYFFKLNRMVEIYIPDLADHFAAEKIDASFYAPSWFITAFSSTFQYSPKSKLLEKIWDYFILDGVKAIFKVTILILKEYKTEILNLKFDSALNFINDLGKQELFTNVKYFEIKEGKAPIDIAPKEYKFVEEFESLMKEMHLSMDLFHSFDDDLEVFEKKIPKLSNKSPVKEKEK